MAVMVFVARAVVEFRANDGSSMWRLPLFRATNRIGEVSIDRARFAEANEGHDAAVIVPKFYPLGLLALLVRDRLVARIALHISPSRKRHNGAFR